MADFRLRIRFAKQGAAIWLSHLEVVRALERCVRRSGLPYAISQGFSPHMKHSFSSALPVGTGSVGEYMDVELEDLVAPNEALEALKATQHECLPIQGASYVSKDTPSLQVDLNRASYLIKIADPNGSTVPSLVERLRTSSEVEVLKKGKPKRYDLSKYLVSCEANEDGLQLTLLSRPEGSLRPEVLLEAVSSTSPSSELTITSLVRVGLEHEELT